MVKIGVVKAQPVEDQPAMDRIQQSGNPAAPPRQVGERPSGADVNEVGEIPPHGFQQRGEKSAPDFQGVDDRGTHCGAFDGEAAIVGETSSADVVDERCDNREVAARTLYPPMNVRPISSSALCRDAFPTAKPRVSKPACSGDRRSSRRTGAVIQATDDGEEVQEFS